jgi:heterodisulfide reductase subunit A-like polyferredoxin
LLTCAELESISGEAGNFQVAVRQQPRFIDLDRCTGCGDCAEACPVTLGSEFEQGLGTRKATYKLYAQAIPSAYAIDKRDRSPCTNACPNSVNAHGYVALISQGKYREAMEVILRTLPLPGVLGRICPHPCETACRRGEVDAPVAICALKRFVADQVDIEEVPVPEIERREEQVAIIGSGPAGLTAAHFLALEGYRVTVFEALPVAGGMLRVGIPDYRLPPEVLDKEIRAITRLGVDIKLNTALGRDTGIDDLFAQGYRAVYLAIGAHRSLNLNIPGEDAEGVVPGVELLRQVNLGELKSVEGRAVIVGGGDVAIDAARSVTRLGAEKVTILYRRTRVEMPAREQEVEEALAEGIEIHYLTAPQQILTKGDEVVGIQCIKMALGEPDSSGRRRPVPVPGSEFIIEAELVVPAIGQTPDSGFLAEHGGIALSRWGTIEADEVTFATNVEGVFAGGDAQTGPWVAIGAVAAGREAAVSISRYLRGEDLRAGREPEESAQENFVPIPEDVEVRARAEMATLPAQERARGFAEVEQGLTEEQARAEAERCLNCMACCECLECVKACKAEAVDHSMQPRRATLEVGAIITAPGFRAFDPSRFDTYAYASLPNVVTSMEFERILSAGGPFHGHLVRPSDHQEPRKIAWLQCVGSREFNKCDNSYCSGVCCMYAIKEAVIAKEHSKNGLETAIFFMDMRTYGKEFEQYYVRAQENGVRFVRCRVHSVDPVPHTDNLRLTYVTEAGELLSEEFDMVVLSVGLESPPEVTALAENLGIEVNRNRFAVTSSFAPVETSKPGVYVCGAFQGPKDIPLSVMEASAAAGAAASTLAGARHSLVEEKTFPQERDVGTEVPRIGVFVCNCGVNIGGVVRVPEVVEYARTLPHVVYVQENLFSCSQDAQENLVSVIREQDLNRVVVAACSPRTHEPLFQETLRNSGLNKYLFEQANIRDQCSWVHAEHPDAATRKAKDLVRMAVARAGLIEPLPMPAVPVTPSALVVGGGVAGMVCALNLARQGFKAHIVEQKDRLGGQALQLTKTWRGEDIPGYIERLVREVSEHPEIEVHLNSRVSEASGFVGNFRTTVACNGDKGERQVEHGATILATGAHPSTPQEYLYGKSDRVFCWHELDEAWESERVKNAKSAVFIQCVGSREPQRPHCSKICCTFSVQKAVELKKRNPEMEVSILYRDLRTYGEREDMYQEARALGVLFIRYSLDRKPVVTEAQDGSLEVQVVDHILQRPITLKPDVITLASAIETRGMEELARMFKVPLSQDSFFLEAHMKLRPVDFATDGVFVCGLAHYPKPLDESIAQAQAAAARAATILAQGEIEVEGVVASVDEALCRACGKCVEVCPYGAPELVDIGGGVMVSRIQEAVCKGCGACAVACPTGAAAIRHFTDTEVLSMVEAALCE